MNLALGFNEYYTLQEVGPCRLEPPKRPNYENDKKNGEKIDETTREDEQAVTTPKTAWY